MVVRGLGLALALTVAALCGACDVDDECDEVAAQLRKCCDKGPPELRDGCIDEAEALEDDGNADACQVDLERRSFERCEK